MYCKKNNMTIVGYVISLSLEPSPKFYNNVRPALNNNTLIDQLRGSTYLANRTEQYYI